MPGKTSKMQNAKIFYGTNHGSGIPYEKAVLELLKTYRGEESPMLLQYSVHATLEAEQDKLNILLETFLVKESNLQTIHPEKHLQKLLKFREKQENLADYEFIGVTDVWGKRLIIILKAKK